MLNRTMIGQTLPAHEAIVERGRLRSFATAIGETDPVYLDEAAAQAAGHPSLPVPPTFLFCLEMEKPDPFGWFSQVGLELSRILHGEQKFTYHAMAYAGDTLRFEPRVTDMYDKKGGALQFLVTDTRVSNQHGQHIADLRGIIVQR
jgi:acyl dehydratase